MPDRSLPALPAAWMTSDDDGWTDTHPGPRIKRTKSCQQNKICYIRSSTSIIILIRVSGVSAVGTLPKLRGQTHTNSPWQHHHNTSERERNTRQLNGLTYQTLRDRSSAKSPLPTNRGTGEGVTRIHVLAESKKKNRYDVRSSITFFVSCWRDVQTKPAGRFIRSPILLLFEQNTYIRCRGWWHVVCTATYIGRIF